MAKKLGIPYYSLLLVSMAVLLLGSSKVYAHSDSLRILSDTSYFRSGEDDWNLLESVSRKQAANALFLLERGADPDASGAGRMTALMQAAQDGDSLMPKILVLNGANLELTDRDETTALMVAVLNQHFDVVYFLLGKGANPDHQDKYGGSALIYAAGLNNYAIADLLLFFGASDTLKDKNGNDAIMTAVSMGNLACTDVLLQNEIRPDPRDKKLNTPLMVAAQFGDLEMIRLLLEYNAGLEYVNSSNYTALAHAIQTGETSAARILVDSGANVNHLIKKNQNLYDLADQQRNMEIKKLLKTKGASPTPKPDFSEIGLGLGNSFNSSEYILQGRIWLQDRKFGYFAETGYDVRVILKKVQVDINDTLIHQYRENRSAWTLGAGKYFTLHTDQSGTDYGFYAALYGMLSFPKYRGISERPPASYNLMPSAGFFLRGSWAGMKVGVERYTFGTLLEDPWKFNLTLFISFRNKSNAFQYKEIRYEQ